MKGRFYKLVLLEDTFNEDNIFIEKPLSILATSERHFEGSAYKIHFIPNVNGTKTLEFSVPVYCIDEKTGKHEINPRYKFLTNERKVRLFFDDKIYNFIIKDLTETRDDTLAKVIKVQCQDAVIEELSKIGWALYFDEFNGIGTLDELMPKVLEGSDWKYDAENSDKFFEEEYLNIDGILNTEEDASQEAQKISYDAKLGRIYHFYGSRKELDLPKADNDEIEIYKYSTEEFVESEVGRNLLNYGDNFYTLDGWVKEDSDLKVETGKEPYERFLRITNTNYFYNNSLDNLNYHFGVHEKCTFSITYKSSAKTELIVEIGDKFGETLNQVARKVISIPATNQWKTVGFDFSPAIRGRFNRVFLRLTNAATFDIGKMRVEQGGRNAILNSSFEQKTAHWSFSGKGETAILDDFDTREDVLKTNQIVKSLDATAFFKSFTPDSPVTLSFDLKGEEFGTIKCRIRGVKNGVEDLQEAELKYNIVWDNYVASFKMISLLGYDSITLELEPSSVVYIDNVKLEQGENTIWTPALEDEIVEYRYSPLASFVTRDHYFYLNEKKEKVDFYPTSFQIKTLKPITGKPEKVRTLMAEKSNTFNLVQTLCELFEGWASFEIAYNEDGSIKTDAFGRREKKISIKKDIGRQLGYGIEYGINLKDVERVIESSEIVTKMYVENNEFEYAKDGIVSIAQAKENESGETYILNFDYYVELGLLPQQAKVDIASYNLQMGSINSRLEVDQTLKNNITTELSQVVEPKLETLELQKVALEEALKKIEDQLGNMLPSADIEGLKAQKTNYQQQLTDIGKNMADLEKKKANYDTQVKDLTEKITESIDKKKMLVSSFNSKYTTFVKEGHWVDDNYIEPNLYYRDAKLVSKRSAYPQVSYTVGMVELSPLEEFNYLKIQVGDKTFVKDKELFLTYKDNQYVPQKIDVFISEIDYALDEPQETTVRVQNYRSRFDDVFQRVMASTESLKLNEQIYDRSSNFTTDQEINVDILQNSLLNNNLILAKSKDNSVVFDSNGITVSDTNNPKRKVKIVSGGIFITKDGLNYKAGITPDGVSIDQLTAGLINTKNIQIWNELEPRFLWDASGLKAYGIDKDGRADTNSVITFNHNGFIFQRDIKSQKAELSLTWDGLKMYLQDGAVQIGSGAGIVVEDNQIVPVKRIEIGKIDRIAGESENYSKENPLAKPVYGMILRNEIGQETLVTSDTGELWLKRSFSVGDKGTEDMAGVSGIVTYTTREIENIIRNEQLIDLEKAIEIGDKELEAEIRKKINAPITSTEVKERKIELEKDPIRFWSGANAPTKASFRVHQSGLIYATNAFIEGDVTATSGHFKGRVYVGYKKDGEINTGAGISGDSRDDVRIWAGAPFVSGSNLESEPEQGTFKVYNSGKVYATNMDVHGLLSVGETKNNNFTPNFFIAGTDYLYNGILEIHATPTNLLARMWVGATTPDNANLVITADGALYSSNIHVSGSIEGKGLQVAQIKIDENGIYTQDFTESGAGTGWFIRNDGTAYFNNVIVRGEISTTTFSKNTIQAAGGSLLVRPSTSLSADIDLTGKENTEVDISVVDSSLFDIDDYIQLRENTNVATLRIISKTDNSIRAIVKKGAAKFYNGCPIVCFGQTGDAGILIASSNGLINKSSGSVIDMTETKITESGDLSEILKLRVGDLTTIPDIDLPNLGYGLYADNVMLHGNVFLPNAGIYSGTERSGGETKVIRFWSGTSFINRHEANFKVYEDGTVLARNGIFEGKIIASEGGFSGSVGLGGITINDNTGTFEIQKRQGNSDRFNTIASFGTDGVTIYNGGLRIFKSLADQSKPKPNTFQYLYPYVFAVNDTDGNHERFVMREFHMWAFDGEDKVLNDSRMNYSIRNEKDGFVFAKGILKDQDKRIIQYQIEDFNAPREDNFIEYIDNENVEMERTSSYLAIKQKDAAEQEIMRLNVSDFKEISGSESNERQYELIINVEMEYSDAENAYLIVKYLPRETSETYELLKYDLPVLKNTKTRLFKDLRVSGYNQSNPMTLIVAVENSTKKDANTSNRLIIHDISIKEVTNTSIAAEKLAYELPEICRFGMMGEDSFGATIQDNGKFLIIPHTNEESKYVKVGINTDNPEKELEVKGAVLSAESLVRNRVTVGSEGAVINNVTKFLNPTIRVPKATITLASNNSTINGEFIFAGGNYYIDEQTSGINPNTFHFLRKTATFASSEIDLQNVTITSIKNNINLTGGFGIKGKFNMPAFNGISIKITGTTPVIEGEETKTTTVTGGQLSFTKAKQELTSSGVTEETERITINVAAAAITANTIQLTDANFVIDNTGSVQTFSGEAIQQPDGSWLIENVNFGALGKAEVRVNATSGNINNAIANPPSKRIVLRSGTAEVNKNKVVFKNGVFDFDLNNAVTNQMKIIMTEAATMNCPQVDTTLAKEWLEITNKTLTIQKQDAVSIIKNHATVIEPNSTLIASSLETEIPVLKIMSLGEKGIEAQSAKIVFENITEEGLRTSVISTYMEHPKTKEVCPGISIWNEFKNSLHQSLKVTGHIFAKLDMWAGRDIYADHDIKAKNNIYVGNELFLKDNARVPVIKYGTAAPSKDVFPNKTPKNGDIYVRY